MLIYELPAKECIALLERVSIARLGSCFENQPYVVPTYLVYESGKFYGFATLGQKTEWMRMNPNVCVEVDDIANPVQWSSVIVNGWYEELSEPQYTAERAHARDLVSRHYNWWQTAAAERQLKSGEQPMEPIFFRISIESMTGLRGIDDPLYSSLTA